MELQVQPRQALRVYGKPVPLPSASLMQTVIHLPSNVTIQLKPEATPAVRVTPAAPAAAYISDDDEYNEIVEAFEFAAEEDDDSDPELAIDIPDHVLSQSDPHHPHHEDDSSCSNGSRISFCGDDLGSQGTGSRNSTSSSLTDQQKPKRTRKPPATLEKRRRRQEEVNRAVQQCRLKRKAMLNSMRTELEQLQATYKRLELRSSILDKDMKWPVFVPDPYPPEMESRRHTKRGMRYKAESEEERLQRVRMQNNQAQYRKALRNKCDEENMRKEIEFLKEINIQMRNFCHNHLRNKRSMSQDERNL